MATSVLAVNALWQLGQAVIKTCWPAMLRLGNRIRWNWHLNRAWVRVCHPFSAERRACAGLDFGWDLAIRDMEMESRL